MGVNKWAEYEKVKKKKNMSNGFMEYVVMVFERPRECYVRVWP